MLILVIAVPIVIGQINQSSQNIHVNKTANYPVNLSSPTASPDSAATPTTVATARFSLLFQNGTAIPSTLAGSFSNFPTYTMWQSPQATGFGSGWQPTSLDTLVVRNDGNVPLNITVSAANVNVPSNIDFAFNWVGIDTSKQTPSGQMNTQVGPIAVGQSATLMLMTNMAPINTNYVSGASFSYNFDIVVSATQA